MKNVNVITTKRVSTLDTTLLKIYLRIFFCPLSVIDSVRNYNRQREKQDADVNALLIIVSTFFCA